MILNSFQPQPKAPTVFYMSVTQSSYALVISNDGSLWWRGLQPRRSIFCSIGMEMWGATQHLHICATPAVEWQLPRDRSALGMYLDATSAVAV